MVLESGVEDRSGSVLSRGVVENVLMAKLEHIEKGARRHPGEGRGQ